VGIPIILPIYIAGKAAKERVSCDLLLQYWGRGGNRKDIKNYFRGY
jgi:hypothetical protein